MNYSDRFRLGTNERGTTLVECSVALPILLFLVIAISDVVRVTLLDISLHHALARATRWGILGEQLDDPSGRGLKLSREQSIKHHVSTIAHSYGVSLPAENVRICLARDPHCRTDSAGGPNDFIVIQVSQSIPLFALAERAISVQADVISKNEPYSS